MRTEMKRLYDDPHFVESKRHLKEMEGRNEFLLGRLRLIERQIEQELDRLTDAVAPDAPVEIGALPKLQFQKEVLERALAKLRPILARAQHRVREGPPSTIVQIRELADPPWVVSD